MLFSSFQRKQHFFMLVILFFTLNKAVGQDSSFQRKITFLETAPSFNKKRFATVVGSTTATYAAALTGLNYLWYAGYPRTRFHWFNDFGEWNQMDKLGHCQTAYFESVFSYQLYKWSGAKVNKAAIGGAMTGLLLQSTIEVFDGFSEKWGASAGDLTFNTIGSVMFLWQELAWHEQRFQIKFSPHIESYKKGVLADRAKALYGSNFAQSFLKDYNAQTYWLSINPASFNKKQKHARWINISLGYGAGNLYGGFSNTWQDDKGNVVDRSDLKRYRSFYLSLDCDFSKIQARSRTAKLFLGILNIFKLPAPALEVNTLGQVIFHPLYFLNWEVPLYLKK
jgi:hypothetical protein